MDKPGRTFRSSNAGEKGYPIRSADISAGRRQKFLGTIVISELLHATRSRQSVPGSQRSQFCVYISLVYGDPSLPRHVPLVLAKPQGVIAGEVKLLEDRAAAETRQKRQEKKEEITAEIREWRRKRSKYEKEQLAKQVDEGLKNDSFYDPKIWPPPRDVFLPEPLKEPNMRDGLYLYSHTADDWSSPGEPPEKIIEIYGDRFSPKIRYDKSRLREALLALSNAVWLEAVPELKERLSRYSQTRFKGRSASIIKIPAILLSSFVKSTRWTNKMLNDLTFCATRGS